jgi:GT2 family glycosyltransferase
MILVSRDPGRYLVTSAGENLGFARPVTSGPLRHSDYLLFLNPDVRIMQEPLLVINS